MSVPRSFLPMPGHTPDPLAVAAAAWHNLHPLARRVTPDQVHGLGVVELAMALPKPGARGRAMLLCSTDSLYRSAPRQLAAWLRRFGHEAFQPPDDLPRRRLDEDALRVSQAERAGLSERALAIVLTAAIDVDGKRLRLLLSPGARPRIFGSRAFSLPRFSVAIGASAAGAAMAGALLATGLPTSSPVAPETRSALAAATSTPTLPKAASMPAETSAARPASAPRPFLAIADPMQPQVGVSAAAVDPKLPHASTPGRPKLTQPPSGGLTRSGRSGGTLMETPGRPKLTQPPSEGLARSDRSGGVQQTAEVAAIDAAAASAAAASAAAASPVSSGTAKIAAARLAPPAAARPASAAQADLRVSSVAEVRLAIAALRKPPAAREVPAQADEAGLNAKPTAIAARPAAARQAEAWSPPAARSAPFPRIVPAIDLAVRAAAIEQGLALRGSASGATAAGSPHVPGSATIAALVKHKAYAIVTRPSETRDAARAQLILMRGLVSQSRTDLPTRLEVMPAGRKWRVAWWPHPSAEIAARHSKQASARGLKVEIVAF